MGYAMGKISQEYKPATLVILSDINTDLGNDTTETTFFQRDYDFSKIDKLCSSITAKKSGAAGSGLSYIKLYVGGTLKQTLTTAGATQVNQFDLIDLSAVTTTETLKLTYQGVAGTDDIILEGIFICVVDT